MNRMLGRLEQAQERQRRFVADVSHDLRSPLTAQRTQLEVAVARPESVDTQQLHRDLLGHVDEMDALVGDLLFVVTDDERPRTRQPLDLEDIVLEEAARVRRLGGPDVDTSRVSAAPVVGDPGELRRLVRNLLENAVAHAHGRSSSGRCPMLGPVAWTWWTTVRACPRARRRPSSSGSTVATRRAVDGAPGWVCRSPARSRSGTAGPWCWCGTRVRVPTSG